jgi:DNA-binding transcriptional MerR regulator
MRISELSERSGVPVATVKYYQREGLLPPGRKVTPRLTEYDEQHLARLTLLRILRDVGDVPVERLRAVLTALESPHATVHQMFRAAAQELAASSQPAPSPAEVDAAEELVLRAGWTSTPPGLVDRDNLARVVGALAEATGRPLTRVVPPAYLRTVDALARGDIEHLDPGRTRTELLADMVVGEVLLGELLLVLRRLGHAHYSRLRFDDPALSPAPGEDRAPTGQRAE